MRYMQMEVKATNSIEDGLHQGVIKSVDERTTKEGYKYVDVIIQFGKDQSIKASYAAFISEESKFGQLLFRFGANLKVGEIVDPEKILIGYTCNFQTVKSGKFSNVVIESVKPVNTLKTRGTEDMVGDNVAV